PCQHALPRVRDGRFAITVLARTEAHGCGGAGSEIFLWTFVQDQIVYSSQSVRWPGNGKTAKFDPAFSVSEPTGGVGPIVGVAGGDAHETAVNQAGQGATLNLSLP